MSAVRNTERDAESDTRMTFKAADGCACLREWDIFLAKESREEKAEVARLDAWHVPGAVTTGPVYLRPQTAHHSSRQPFWRSANPRHESLK